MQCDSSTSRMARYTGTDPGTIHATAPPQGWHDTQARTQAQSMPWLGQSTNLIDLVAQHRLIAAAFSTTIGAARPSSSTSTNTRSSTCIGAATINGSTPTLHQAAPTDKRSATPPFDHPLISSKLIKHIPKSARPACCRRLSELLNEVTANTDYKSVWTALLSFGTNYLLPPKRAGKRRNMATVMKKRLEKGAEHDDVKSTSPNLTRRCKLKDDGLLAAAVTSKIEDGNIRAVARILVLDDKPAADTLETLASLHDKHPHPGVAYNRLPPDNVIHKALQVDEDDVLRAIPSFSAGSSGGPDGLRPQHILELVTRRIIGAELVITITASLDGRFHADVVPILFDGSLIALQKKSNGIRPLAIGYT